MRITQQSSSQLLLTGIPGGRLWMVVLVCLGSVLTAAVVWFSLLLYEELDGLAGPHLALAVGLLIAQALFWTGAVTLVVGRLSLVLNTMTGHGEYRVRSPIVDAGRPCKFKLKHIDNVTLETCTESRPGRSGQGDSEATVHRVRLRLNKPRRAIILDETEHGQLDRLEVLAQQVAGFLGKTPLRIDQTSP